MLISLNAIKRYVKIPDSVSEQELIKLIGSRLVEVESTESLAEKYQNIYIAKVVTCTDIPGTHLHLCEIDAGDLNRQFSTLENGLIQVVCGAPNVRAGIFVAWLAPGAIVPATYGTENFKLSVRKLRGFESYGMIAGPDELGFGNEHKYIAEIAPGLANPGSDFSKVFDLNDLIIDIENKSLTHRPDTFGLIGFAREVAGILGQPFENPTIYEGDFISQVQDFSNSPNDQLIIEVESAELCARYSCVILEQANLRGKPVLDFPDPENRPLTKDAVFLYKAGMRPISQIVDATNLTMLKTGQPLHAFDYDKFIAVGGTKTPKIIIRRAVSGEKITLLDNTEVILNENDIIVTSNNVPVALAGAMGGKSTEIDAHTKRILLESATFSLYNLRKTQMAHGIFSEAITRFTKGQPAFGTIPALKLCLNKLGIKNFTKLSFSDHLPSSIKQTSINFSLEDLNQTLGSHFSVDTIKHTLSNVGFCVVLQKHDQGNMGILNIEKTKHSTASMPPQTMIQVTVPLWRTDIHIKEDIYEEVGRLTGFDNIPRSLPVRPFKGSPKNPLFSLKTQIRNILSDEIGANELLTYSFVSQNLQQKVDETISDSYEIINSISPELQRFRQSLIPSLLEKTYENHKAGFKDFILYEMNQVTKKTFGLQEDQTPKMESHLAACLEGDFYQVKAICLALGRRLGFDFTFSEFNQVKYPYFESLHSVNIQLGEQTIGALGEINQSVQKAMKLKKVAALELDLSPLLSSVPVLRGAKQYSRYPFVSRDLTIKTPDHIAFEGIQQQIESGLAENSIVSTITPVSIYRQNPDDPTRNCSFHLEFSSTKKTLGADEISAIMKQIEHNITELGAEII